MQAPSGEANFLRHISRTIRLFGQSTSGCAKIETGITCRNHYLAFEKHKNGHDENTGEAFARSVFPRWKYNTDVFLCCLTDISDESSFFPATFRPPAACGSNLQSQRLSRIRIDHGREGCRRGLSIGRFSRGSRSETNHDDLLVFSEEP